MTLPLLVNKNNNPAGQEERRSREEEGNQRRREDEEEGKKKRARRLGVGLWEGSGISFSQSWSRSATYSSDDSDSENGEMWEELQEIRER